MNKKDLKFYEAPACEVVELEASVALLASSDEHEFDSGQQTPGGGDE